MNVFFPLHRRPGVVGGVEDLVGETHRHGRLASLPGEVDQPADGQALLAPGRDLDRNLVRAATDPPRPHFHLGPDVVDGALQDDTRILAGPLLDGLQGPVDDVTGGVLLPLPQDLVDDLADEDAPEHRIGLDLALLCRRPTHQDSFFEP